MDGELVEAAGVEPASEEVDSREPTYLVALMRPRGDTFAARGQNATRNANRYPESLASILRWRMKASLLCDALSRPVGEAVESGYLTN